MKRPPPPSSKKWYNTKINFYMVLLVVSSLTSGGVMYRLGLKTGEQKGRLWCNQWQVECYLKFLEKALLSHDQNGTIENGK